MIYLFFVKYICYCGWFLIFVMTYQHLQNVIYKWIWTESVCAFTGQLSLVSTSRVDGPSTRLVETTRPARQHGPCWRVMETSHPSTQVVETGLYCEWNSCVCHVTCHVWMCGQSSWCGTVCGQGIVWYVGRVRAPGGIQYMNQVLELLLWYGESIKQLC